MPYIVQLNDFLEVKYACYDTVLKQVALNIFQYQVTSLSAPGVTDQDCADALYGILEPGYEDILSPQSCPYGLKLQKIYPGGLTLGVFAFNAAKIGTFGTVPAPAQLSMVVTKQTGGAGRAKRGRFYMPLPPIEAIDSFGTPTNAYLTAMAPLLANLVAPQTITTLTSVAQLTPVLWHNASGTGTTLTSLRPNDKFGTQRRRGIYGRENAIPPF